MTDVFISYAHEDQDFVRRMVRALEADGLTVWWDHTIPPGQSWDTFIARGIREAKCAIVVWSRHSVESDWVKEEATVARGGQKYLPVQIDGSNPPMGFTRIQAANLVGWSGDTNNPQWRMLATEAGKLARADGPPPGPGPQIRPPPPPAPRPSAAPARNPAILIGAAVVAIVLLIGGVSWLATHSGSKPEVAEVETTTTPPAEEPAQPPAEEVKPAVVKPDPSQAELERLRRENKELVEQRDAAAKRAAAQEQARAAPAPAPAPSYSGARSVSGAYFRGDVPGMKGGTWCFASSGVLGYGQKTRWSQDGSTVRWADISGQHYEAKLSGATLSGRAYNGSNQDIGYISVTLDWSLSNCVP